MESRRLILFFVFSFSLFMLLDAWQRDQRVNQPVGSRGATESVPGSEGVAPPAPSEKLLIEGPAGKAAPPAPAGGLGAGEVIRVETDLFIADISTVGGDLRRLELRQHRHAEDRKSNFILFETRPDHTYVAQSGMIGPGLPTHRTVYTSAAREYQLGAGQDVLVVRLEAPGGEGVATSKEYSFRRGTYVIDVAHEVANRGSEAIQPFAYFQLLRDGSAPAGDSAMLPTYTGAAVFTEASKFVKVSFGDIEKNKTPYPKSAEDGWVAMLQHYFFSAWLPAPKLAREFYTRHFEGGLYAAGVILPVGPVSPGEIRKLSVPLYAGPQEQQKLAELAPGLDLTIDYGWLTIISVPLFWVLAWIQQWVGNWGVAIILLTVLIKLLFYPLSEASYRSMGKMRVLAPKLQKLKEQYGDDRQRMQQAMMEMYKAEKVNPLGGCLPILVQIPVFIALYWVLLASVELRHAPFMLWIQDLSVPDPWFILPLLMGATMIIQTRLNPEPPDPLQAKIMKIMPVAFSVFFFFFPAGLVLYWLINNILSIAQQWHINRVLERANLAAVAAHKR